MPTTLHSFTICDTHHLFSLCNHLFIYTNPHFLFLKRHQCGIRFLQDGSPHTRTLSTGYDAIEVTPHLCNFVFGKQCFFFNIVRSILTLRNAATQLLELSQDTLLHKVRIFTEYHSVRPLVGIGTLPRPLTPASVPLPPCRTKGAGAHSPAGEGLGESQFRRLEKSLSL